MLSTVFVGPALLLGAALHPLTSLWNRGSRRLSLGSAETLRGCGRGGRVRVVRRRWLRLRFRVGSVVASGVARGLRDRRRERFSRRRWEKLWFQCRGLPSLLRRLRPIPAGARPSTRALGDEPKRAKLRQSHRSHARADLHLFHRAERECRSMSAPTGCANHAPVLPARLRRRKKYPIRWPSARARDTWLRFQDW